MSSGNSGAGAPGGASGGTGIGGGSGAGGGGSSSGTNAASAGRSRLHSPPVELPSSNAQNFFEEAKITKTEEMELRRKFGKFCTKSPASGGEGGEEEVYLTLDNFCRMLQYYECASAQHYESYFHAIDRNHDDRLDFQEFFLGCCAADPSTVHILNSFTGYERSQYIFDFYDTNRSNTLEFDEFARLTADCLSLPCSSSTEEQAIRAQAVEKARDLGALEDSGDGLIQFSCIRFKKFYEYVQNERLRGTSRLFRFYKSIIKSRGSHSRRNQGSSASGGGGTPAGGASGGGGSGHTPTAAGSHAVEEGTMVASVEEDLSDREDCEWHAHLLDLDSYFDPDGDEPLATVRERPSPPPYVVLPPPAPAPSLRPEAEPPAADARAVARKVLRALNAQHFDGLLPNGAGSVDASDAPFEIVTPAQLRCLCSAAIRLLETEDMVLQGLQPPVKVFGALHGQLLDLLSHFKWHQAPVEAVGDILYTTYVFLGDYADRGSHCLEVLTLLLSLKVAHPHRVALLRGQHENRHLNYHLGLRLECERRLGAIEGFKVFDYLNRFFEHLSLAAVIGGSILALGPGVLPQSLTRFDQLKRYRKPLQLPHTSQPRPANALERLNEQVLLECFTPGPLMPRELGAVREALPEQVKLICSRNDFATVVRSRPVPGKGFSFEAGGRVVSVTSCLNYCDLPGGNDAAVLLIAKEENSSNLVIKPQVITADVAKIYGVLGRPFGGEASSGPPPPLRWPAQPRDATPGRCVPNPAGLAAGPGDAAASESTALVIYPDRNVVLDSSLALVAFPALGPGRPPGGLMRQGGAASMLCGAVGRTASGDSPQAAARGKSGDGTEVQKFNSAVNSNEDWQLRPNLRGSLPRRSGGSASTKVPQHESHSEAKIRGTSASGRVHADSSMSETAEAGGAIPKASASPAKGALPRNPATGAGSGSFGASAVAAAAHAAAAATAADGQGGTAHRRGGASPTSDPVRPSLSGPASGVPAGVPANGGAPCPSGGRDPRVVTNVAARNGTGGPKAKDQQRGPSRPPGSVAPSPKVSAASSAVGGPRAQQPTRRAGAGEAPGSAVPTSPRQSSVGGEEEEPFLGPPTDPRSLLRLLQDSPRLVAGALPPMPAQHLQNARAVEQPLVLHLCRIWLESGLSDKDWAQALHMFEGELCDQPRQQPKAGALPPSIAAAAGAGGEEEEQLEGRWTLETFSMWLLKRGRRLRECSQWFRAFDFDQDEMVGVADFLQGLVASAAPRAPQPGSAGGLCASLALFRLLDLEKRQSLDGRDLEAILAEAQVSLGGPDFQLTVPQVAQRATDFEFFRNTIFPKLQGASAFRLRALGAMPPRE